MTPPRSPQPAASEAVRAPDGWTYIGGPTSGDARKIVTLEKDGMVWIGIRAYHATEKRWINNGEFEQATVVAWRDLPDIATSQQQVENDLSRLALDVLGWPQAVPPAAPANLAERLRAVCDALGFDPTNHHNAAKCPYCTPALAASAAGADVRAFEAGTDGWLPIERAPRDGTRILAALDDADDMTPQIIRWWKSEVQSEGWVLAWDGESVPSAILGAPTHWRPLPAPPRATTTEPTDDH